MRIEYQRCAHSANPLIPHGRLSANPSVTCCLVELQLQSFSSAKVGLAKCQIDGNQKPNARYVNSEWHKYILPTDTKVWVNECNLERRSFKVRHLCRSWVGTRMFDKPLASKFGRKETLWEKTLVYHLVYKIVKYYFPYHLFTLYGWWLMFMRKSHSPL